MANDFLCDHILYCARRVLGHLGELKNEHLRNDRACMVWNDRLSRRSA